MIIDKFNLEGKVAIVTGSSTGLGQGMIIGLAEAGADIAGVDYIESTETREKVEKIGRKFLEIKANLLTTESVKGIIEKTVKEYGRVDILINNAGIIRREDAINFAEKDWDDVMSINVKTLFFFSQAIAKQFIRQKRVPSYTASKSAVMGLTRALANEWAKYNINVNAIAPGYMATNNTKALREDKDRSNAILDRIPAGRWGLPEDVAGPAVFLASEAANYINGYTIAVDGGWLAR